MEIHKSAEDYLETIFRLMKEKGQVRSIDVVADMHFSKPSVSVAMKKLRENGYISMDEENLITLTTQGQEIASRMLHRHRAIATFFEKLGVDEATALEDACKIEHDISEASFHAICRFLDQA